MARPLQLVSENKFISLSQVSFAVGTLFLCALALFMCASHSRKWRKWRACYEPDEPYYYEHEPVIQLNHEQIIEGYHSGDVDASTCSGDISVWKKNIIMGGKCQLPDFSGVIIYDTAGNLVNNPRPLALTWK